MSVIVIGAGMTGIAAGYYLRMNHIPYTILEAKSDLGGVWHSHRWHGARCDSDFIKYSFSFRPFLSDRCLQSRSQIQAYLRDVAQEFGILEHIRFNTRVLKAVFDSPRQCWLVHTANGVFTAQFLINGNGYFGDEPYVPAFKDEARFKGEIIHTSHLDDQRKFPDKKVVLVGSGSTAICAAPELAAVAGSLVLLQRSPSYIYEISNDAAPLIRLCQNLYRRGLRTPVRWLRSYLQLRDDVIFLTYPVGQRPDLSGYLRLAAEGLPLTAGQKKALSGLLNFNDEEDDEILYIDQIPRPCEPWHVILNKVVRLWAVGQHEEAVGSGSWSGVSSR